MIHLDFKESTKVIHIFSIDSTIPFLIMIIFFLSPSMVKTNSVPFESSLNESNSRKSISIILKTGFPLSLGMTRMGYKHKYKTRCINNRQLTTNSLHPLPHKLQCMLDLNRQFFNRRFFPKLEDTPRRTGGDFLRSASYGILQFILGNPGRIPPVK